MIYQWSCRLALASLGTAALLWSMGAEAQDKPIQLKLSHWVPPSHAIQGSIEDWANDVKKQSNGTITAMVFPAEQLGKAFDHYDMTRDGIADGAYVSPGYQPGRFPIVSRSDIPFTYRDGKTGTAAVDSWYRKYAAREMQDVHFCFAFLQDPGGLFSRTKIVVPADIRGLKVRPPNATLGNFVSLLGGTNVQASASQSRDVLERGTADAIFFPWQSTILFGIDKVTKYAVNAPFYAGTFVWVLNKAKYDGMSAGQKAVIDDHCTTEWAVRFASPWVDYEEPGRARIKAEPGHEEIELTPEQLQLWRQAAEPLVETWSATIRKSGGDPDVIQKEFAEALKAKNAGLNQP